MLPESKKKVISSMLGFFNAGMPPTHTFFIAPSPCPRRAITAAIKLLRKK